MKTITIIPEAFFVIQDIACKTFGVDEFTYIPVGVEEEYRKDKTKEFFWHKSLYCLCFFPRRAWEVIMTDYDTPKNRKGFEAICKLLDCSEQDVVVAICIESLSDSQNRENAVREYLSRISFSA